MNIQSSVTEQDLINLLKLAEQQKNQRALKIKNRISKQTHDLELAESLSLITKKLEEVKKSTQESLSPITKKLDIINDSTKQLGEKVEESNSENNKEMTITPSIFLQDTFKSLSEANKSLKLNQDKNHNTNILGVSIKPLGGDKMQVYESIYEYTPAIHRALSDSSYTGKSMRNENDRRTLYNF